MNKNMVMVSVIGMSLALASSTAWAEPGTYTLEERWQSPAELKTPESAVYDPVRKLVYVSNINGSPTELDANGFITALSPDGAIVELKWVEGLHAPKGLAIQGDRLYVADQG